MAFLALAKAKTFSLQITEIGGDLLRWRMPILILVIGKWRDGRFAQNLKKRQSEFPDVSKLGGVLAKISSIAKLRGKLRCLMFRLSVLYKNVMWGELALCFMHIADV